MNKSPLAFIFATTICGSFISVFAQTNLPSTSAELEAIKRILPQQESIEIMSEKARKNLQEKSSAKDVADMIEKIVLPAAWTQPPQCLQMDRLVIDKTWGREAVAKTPWREIPLVNRCLEPQQFLAQIGSAVQALADQGYLVTSVSPAQTIEGHSAHVSVHLVALDQFVFQDSANAMYLQGLDLKEGEPINLHELDELIERIARLRSNDPHLNISLSSDYKFATLHISNLKSSKNFYFDAGVTDRSGSRIHNASASAEDVLGQGEVLALSGQYTMLSSGHSSLKTISMDTPVGNTLLSVSYSEGGSRTTFFSNEITRIWLSNDRSTKVGVKTNIFRNHNTLLSLSAGVKTKNTQTWIDEYLTESQSPNLSVGELGLSFKYLLDSQNFFSSELNFKSGMSILGAQRDSNIIGLTRSDAHAQFAALSSTNVLSSPLDLFGKNYRWINIIQLFSAQHGLYPSEQFLMSSSSGAEGFYKSQTLADKAVTLKTSLSSEWSVPWLNRPLQSIFSYAYAKGNRYVDTDQIRLKGAGLQLSYAIAGGVITCNSYFPDRNIGTVKDSASFSLAMQIAF